MPKRIPQSDAARAFARHRIDFDPDDTATYAPHTIPLATRRKLAPIPWPKGREPKPWDSIENANKGLPKSDVLIVTWTVAEAMALADALTPGHPSKTGWAYYDRGFADYKPMIRKGAPASNAGRLGSYWMTMIADKRVCCFKSELHMSQDGAQLPVARLWKQIIEETGCKMVITTGTAGGIGPDVQLGDVVLAQSVRFDCTKEFKRKSWAQAEYKTTVQKLEASVGALLYTNANELPPAKRAPKVWEAAIASHPDVVTTDFFAFDDSDNSYHLQGLGLAVEMGDAVLGMVLVEMGDKAPAWAAVRNASDPQMDTAGMTAREVRQKAARIYERYGYWTSINSAIVCASLA